MLPSVPRDAPPATFRGCPATCHRCPPPTDESRVQSPALLELVGDLPGQRFGRGYLRERSEAEDPALERLVEADVERHADAATVGRGERLRAMPVARAHVVDHGRLKIDRHALGWPGVHADRVRKRVVTELLDRRESLLLQ